MSGGPFTISLTLGTALTGLLYVALLTVGLDSSSDLVGEVLATLKNQQRPYLRVNRVELEVETHGGRHCCCLVWVGGAEGVVVVGVGGNGMYEGEGEEAKAIPYISASAPARRSERCAQSASSEFQVCPEVINDVIGPRTELNTHDAIARFRIPKGDILAWHPK